MAACPCPWGPLRVWSHGRLSLQVNSENVVKVGHRQVVNMIRQGGNHLVLKVVTVTRNLDPDDTARKKGACSMPPPPRPHWPSHSPGRGRDGLGMGLGTFSCVPHLLPLGGPGPLRAGKGARREVRR